MKSIHNCEVKENIQENQRGIFLVNTVSKIYESALKIQNENKNENMSQMQTAGRKQRSAVDNLIILNSIIENQRQYKNKTYIFFADAKKCFDKLWLKDCLIEMYNLGYSPDTIRSLYEINKTSNIVVDTTVGKTSSITVEEAVKQGTTFGPIMCCASTSRVNEIQEAVKYQYGKVEIGMPVFMDDIAAVGTADNIRKGIQNCRRMEIEKKMIYGLKKTKYMVINTGKEPEEVIEERVKEGIVQETDIYKYLGMVINKLGNLKDHILELNRKCEVINREINAIGAKHQVGKEGIRVKLKLYETCLMQALL